jgi:hypothetical protein
MYRRRRQLQHLILAWHMAYFSIGRNNAEEVEGEKRGSKIYEPFLKLSLSDSQLSVGCGLGLHSFYWTAKSSIIKHDNIIRNLSTGRDSWKSLE